VLIHVFSFSTQPAYLARNTSTRVDSMYWLYFDHPLFLTIIL